METIRHTQNLNIRKGSATPGINADRQYDFYSNMGHSVDIPLWTKRQGVDISTLYELVKELPEVARCIIIKIEDLLSNGWIYTDASDMAVKKAKAFERDTQFYKKLADALWDVHLSGWGFILKLRYTEEEVKSIVAVTVKNYPGFMVLNKGMSETAVINKLTAQVMASDVGRTRDLQVLAADTVKPEFDDAGRITKIVNTVGTKQKTFDPKDVIVLSFYNIGGRMYPFTPAMSLLNDAAQLIESKAYSGNVIRNKGLPPMALSMEDANGEDDPNVKFIEKQIKSYRNNKEQWGRIMLLTGKVTTIKLDSETKDLEYAKIISHWTRLMITAWGIPPHRYFWSDPDTRPVPPKEANEGYFSGLSFQQKVLEGQLYAQLWKEFNVFGKFHRGYMVDELRNANVVALLADRRLISKEEAREMADLGLKREYPTDETEINPAQQQEGNNFDEPKDDRGETPMGNEGKDNSDKKTRSITASLKTTLNMG